jgi:hypothetical protein
MALAITTTGQNGITQTTITFLGNITSVDTPNPTKRGFQYNTVQYPDKEVYETGSFGTGSFSLDITGLTPGTTYYIRAFAEDVNGTVYGTWITVTTSSSEYKITIDGVDRTNDIINQTPVIEDAINDQQNFLSFQLMDLNSIGIPSNDDEVIVYLDDDTKLFGGNIISIEMSKKTTGSVVATIRCVDYSRVLDSNLVHKSYEDMTDKAIIEDIVATYCAGLDITTTNVVEGVTIEQVSFNYVQPSQALRKIADLTGRNWYIDYDKDIHYFPLTTNTTPFNIDSSNNEYYNLRVSKDASQIKNRIYVRGGTKLSDETTYSEKGDGEKRKFVLPDKPHAVTVTVNGVEKTLGIKNVNADGFEWYLNFQEKYLEQDSTETVLSTSDTLEVTYKYDIPILVALENSASIIEHGIKEFAIFDKQISTTKSARDRASAELTDYANNIIEGSFKTLTTGFTSGQYININLTEYGLNEDYIIQKVVANSIGGGVYEYTISMASAKTMGIIRFLIELLEDNRNLITLDENEVVDELFTINDSLLSDSLVDSLITDSAGPYSTWAEGEETEPNTVAKWGLFQWG